MKKLLASLFFFLSVSAANAGVSCSVPFNLTNGTTADASQVMANYNAILSCLLNNTAESGANSSITALVGLTTPIPANAGGSTVFLGGTSTNVGNAYSVTITVPPGFSGTKNYSVVFVANAANTATASLAVNAGTATSIYKQSITGPVPLTGGEIQPNQTVVTWFDGTQWEMMPPFPGVNAASLVASTLPSLGAPINMQLNATTASNQLTLAVVGVNGSALSASNPVLAAFNNAGQAAFATIATTTSFTLSSTSSLGCTTAVLCRLWVELICQTVSTNTCSSALIGASVQSVVPTPQCFPLNEGNLQSTGSGTGGGTAVNTIQTSVASLTSKPIRIVGYIEAVWTSGTGWGSPSAVVLMSPGIKRPCDVLGEVYVASTATSSMNNSTFTVTGVSTGSYTLQSTLNLIDIDAGGWAGINSTSAGVIAQVQRGATALGVPIENFCANNCANGMPVSMTILDAPNAASATYAIYGKLPNANATVWQGGTIKIKEIMG